MGVQGHSTLDLHRIVPWIWAKARYILCSPMAISLSSAVKMIRENGNVPIGVLSYNVAEDKLDILLLLDVDAGEAAAILSKFNLGIIIEEDK